MKIILNKAPFSKKRKNKIKNRILQFIKKEKMINVFDNLTIDWTPRDEIKFHEGYYGTFLTLYKNRIGYINVTMFYEIDNLKNINQVLWGVFHDLIHCKQMYLGEIKVSDDASYIIYNNKKIDKLNFRKSIFVDKYAKNPQEATEYHIKEIPWENECYYKSDIYTGRVSFNHNIFLNKKIEQKVLD